MAKTGRPKSRADRADGKKRQPVVLSPEARDVVEKWNQKTGLPMTGFVERLVLWFASAPPSMQQIIFGQVPADMIEQYAERSADYFDSLIRERASTPTAGRVTLDASAPTGSRKNEPADPGRVVRGLAADPPKSR